ncbi:MAG: multiheme c-type cytochrome [Myxococcota bacterium]|jgi:peroxiredoxin|nr:multiheme c-type cytochrome [Myxococcota bacterium]
MHSKPALLLVLISIAGAALLLSACRDKVEVVTAETSATSTATPAAVAVASKPPSETAPQVELVAKRHPSERPLQAFRGTGLEGERLSISNFIGKRLTLFVFNPEVPDASFVSDAVSRVAAARGKQNFHIVGIAVGSSTAKARAFASEKGFDFPVFDDSRGTIASQLGVRSPVGIYGFDNEGYFDFAIGFFNPNVPDPAGVVEEQLREKLRLPAKSDDEGGRLDPRPTAPNFVTRQLDSDEPFDFASIAGKPAIIIFFLHTCPHCHSALDFLKEHVLRLPKEQRPEVIAISAANRPSAVRAMLKEQKLEDFEGLRVLLDPDSKVMESYGVFAGFPDLFMIDAKGKIVHRTQGWREHRDPAMNRMVLAKIAEARIPMLLNPRGYTGSDVCSVCHEVEAQTHVYTNHASAYSTIVKHNETRNPECVDCHVVGFGEPGGYSIEQAPVHLENVGCETCHGRGGPHLSPDFVPKNDGVKNYESICRTCHNPTHSLSFDFATFLQRVSHKSIASLDDKARGELISSDRGPRDVLPKNADYVGSQACQSCHPSEFATWSASAHSKSVESLSAKGKADDADCLACHTTAMGRKGGFPADGRGSDTSHGDLASVGCESCHGPGGNHIAKDAKKLGTIVSLGDKCDSCAILKICGSCHDDANDPGFEFRVDERIEHQRHGTIEPGTGKPIHASPTAMHQPGRDTTEEALARVFRLIDEQGS